MEFELGRTYSGYKFLDIVERSRHVVQYRVQNTLTQRLENLRALPLALPVDGRMVMTTEIPESLSLAERLKLGPLPWQDALAITRQLLGALSCLHQQSMLHCGLTPESVFFGPHGFCKLADFALF